VGGSRACVAAGGPAPRPVACVLGSDRGASLVLDRDAILAAVELAGLADELLGQRTGTTASPSWPCPNPHHAHTAREPSDVTIYLTRSGEQRWHCHGCGTGGTAIDLVMKARRTGVRDALLFLDRYARSPSTPAAARPTATTPIPPEDRHPRTGLDAWVAHASHLLWQPYGDAVREWLTCTRRIPDVVLRANRIGATAITPDHVLSTRRDDLVRVHAGAAAPAAVLPVIAKDQAIYVQLRLINPPADQPAYLNPPTSATTRHPRLGLYRPPQRQQPEILVTNGIIDALSANAAGYRAAAVLSPGLADAEVAVHLSRLHGPLVLALDPNGPGDEATDRLMHHLTLRGRRPAILPALHGDLNETLVAANDWPRKLAAHVRHATASSPPDLVPGL
jgi:hypothetical protein